MVDCKYIIAEKSFASTDVISACITAKATVEGARVQLWNLVAGALALFAGACTVYSAKIQIKPLVNKSEKEINSYKKNVYILSGNVINNCELILLEIDAAEELCKTDPKRTFNVHPIAEVPSFNHTEWRDHALLGEKAFEQIIILRSLLNSTNIYIDDYRGKTLDYMFKKTLSRSFYPGDRPDEYSIWSPANSIRSQLKNLSDRVVILHDKIYPKA